MTQNIGTLESPRRRYHRIAGWRGYWVPANAVAGASDTGTFPDSPCPTPDVLRELKRFRKEVLKPAGIGSRLYIGQSSIAFCIKRWVMVDKKDFAEAARLTREFLANEDNARSFSYLHGASLAGYFKEN